MGIALLVALLTAAPNPGEPAPRRDLPRGLESSRWDELWVEDCAGKMAEHGEPKSYYFSRRNRLQERKRRGYDTIYCHAPQASIWTRGPTGIRYYGFTMFNCVMAVAMARFEAVAQDEARKWFGDKYEHPIKAIRHMGTYNCRRLRKKPNKQSQHSFGNAIDLASFWVRGVGEVSVEKHWDVKYPYLEPRRDFLRALVQRLRDEHVFTNVLDPTWDAFHDNHIHVDVAPLSDGLPSPALAVNLGKPLPVGPPPLDANETPSGSAADDADEDEASGGADEASGGADEATSPAAPE